jgi:DNA-binding transcriptional LysR family regulator
VLSLEEELGVKLFDRIGRRIIPTQAGHLLHIGVSKIFRIMEQARADIHDLQNDVCGQVVVGGSTIPANYLLPMVISDFCRRYPQVCVDLRIGDSIQICQDVLAGKFDFGIVGGLWIISTLSTNCCWRTSFI